jgi:hypothetical protein
MFLDVLEVEETTPLEAGVREYETSPSGVGLLEDVFLRPASFGL